MVQSKEIEIINMSEGTGVHGKGRGSKEKKETVYLYIIVLKSYKIKEHVFGDKPVPLEGYLGEK